MRRKIFFVLIIMFLFTFPYTTFAEVISTPEPHDYNNGLLDDENLIKTNTLPGEVYDNDGSSMVTLLNQPYTIELYYPTDITAIMYQGYNGKITFYFNNGEEVESTTINGGGYDNKFNPRYEDVFFSDVVKIEIIGDKYAPVNTVEIDFFGSYSTAPIDSDGDGIPDHEDPYPDDPTNGDRDGDGIPDDEDPYPDDPENTPIDSDGDGIPDDEDPYPDDPTNNGDTDLDGIPDDEDIYPDDPDNEQPEVENLKVEVEPGRADLSWKNPPKYFEKAIIYRMDLGEVTANNFSLSDLNPFKPMVVHAETYTPLFETNGTTFSDLTVKENNEYEYKVTTMYQGNESQGVTIRTVAPPPPPVDFTNTEIPFGVNELVSSGSGLLGLIGGFVLLALAFVFAPKVINLIKNSFSSTNPKADKIDRSLYSTRLPRQAREPRISTYQPREPRMSKRG